MKRISIDACDIAILINRDIRTAQRLIRTIKDVLNKEPHQRLTIKEYCAYEDFPFEETFNMINNNKEEAAAMRLSQKNKVDSKDDKKSG